MGHGTLPAGQVTFLFSDIEGSTKRWERDAEGMRVALDVHRRHTVRAIAEHDGALVKDTGDGAFAAFASARSAVLAAVDLQRRLADARWPDDVPLRVRIGIHTGPGMPGDGDYHGRAVNRCARVMGAAHGGQVLVTEETAAEVAEVDGIALADLGLHRLPDFSRPARLHQVLHQDLPAHFPPLRTLDGSPNNLPEQAASLVGRREELAELRSALTESRLVTLTGAGGVGKTRLAVQLGAEVLHEHPDGVWLVELGMVQTLEHVERAVAAALRVPDRPGRTTIEALIEFVASRKLLVIIDNCEHVLEPISAVAARLLDARDVRVVATSREPLAVTGERVFAVPPLSVDGGDAMRLFIERATAASRDFDGDSVDADVVGSICRRLDGLPLAIELAAARVRVMSVREIDRRLDDRFRLLTGGSRTALPRQRTLEATVAWSHDLLPGAERILFARLAAFASPFRIDDAEAVVDVDVDDGAGPR